MEPSRVNFKSLILLVVPGRKTPTNSSTSPVARSATPEKSPVRKDYHRSASSASDVEARGPKQGQPKFSTVGASIGAKLAGQVKAMETRRAKVLPNEELDPAIADKILPKELGKFLIHFRL